MMKIAPSRDERCVTWLTPNRMAFGTLSGGIFRWSESGDQIDLTLEGHTKPVIWLAATSAGRVLVSRSRDGTVRLWNAETGACVGILKDASRAAMQLKAPVLVTVSRDRRTVCIWDLDTDRILATGASQKYTSQKYTTARIALVGDSGVGKTGLGWRLAHGKFKEQSSTHGQQFWVLKNLPGLRNDGAECEAVLWDFAGQPDYRLIHALFLDHIDLALILFDPGQRDDALKGVEYWLKALERASGQACRKILIAARLDRAQPALTPEDLAAYCVQHGIHGGYVGTSAAEGTGVEALRERMRESIAWDELTATVTTATFKRIKEYVLKLKEAGTRPRLLAPADLQAELEKSDSAWTFSGDEMMAAVGHLSTHGYVAILRGSDGRQSILMAPEALTNLAASVVLEARRHPKGLGALEEDSVLRGEYQFPELANLPALERAMLLDAAVALFLEHNVCFRERLGPQTLLIFPALINQKAPILEDVATTDDVSYTIQGAVENVYAVLVVLLGYTNTFTRTNQWQNQARYEVAAGQVCGFRQTAEREGEIEVVHYHSQQVPEAARLLFQGLFETFLQSRRVKVTRYQPVACPNCGYRQQRLEVVKRIQEGKLFLYCGECGREITLPKAATVVEAGGERDAVAHEGIAARRRTEFETALAKLKGYLRDRKPRRERPSCFISYAWGEPGQEQFAAKLGRDLENADVHTTFDRRDNSAPGANIARFVSAMPEADFVAVVGTPEYLRKSTNAGPGSVVAAELDVINQRLTGTEEAKRTILPLLLEGTQETAFPALLRGRVYADFTSEERYLGSAFDVILTLHGIPLAEPVIAELREQAGRDALLS